MLTGLFIIFCRPIAQHVSEQKQNDLVKQWETALQNVANNTDTEDTDSESKALPKNMIGILKIDKIDFEMPVLKGTATDTLKISAGTIEPTAMPADGGNFCLAVHNSLRNGKYLNRVMELDKGDAITYQDKDVMYEYKITECTYVEPTDTSVLEQAVSGESASLITIVTCYPADTAEQRYVVRGELIQSLQLD